MKSRNNSDQPILFIAFWKKINGDEFILPPDSTKTFKFEPKTVKVRHALLGIRQSRISSICKNAVELIEGRKGKVFFNIIQIKINLCLYWTDLIFNWDAFIEISQIRSLRAFILSEPGLLRSISQASTNRIFIVSEQKINSMITLYKIGMTIFCALEEDCGIWQRNLISFFFLKISNYFTKRTEDLEWNIKKKDKSGFSWNLKLFP